MARQKSPALLQAMELVAQGATVYRASKITGITQSVIARSINPPVKKKCPCCGKTITKKKGKAP